MAAPVDASRIGTSAATAATSFNINVGSPTAARLLIVFVRFGATPGTVTFTGYTQLFQGYDSSAFQFSHVWYRVADGTEGASDVLTTTGSTKLAAICWQITGADPATLGLGMPRTAAAANIDPLIAGAGPFTWDDSASTAYPIQGTGGANAQVAQSFTATSTSIISVGSNLGKVLSPSDNIIVEIQSDSGGSPSGTVLATVATIAGTSSFANFTESAVSLSTLTVGNKYWIVFRRSGARDTTNYYAVSNKSSVQYTGGECKTFGSSSWGSPQSDIFFHVIAGDVKDYLFLTMLGMDSETATATAPPGYSNTVTANSGTAGTPATNVMLWGASKQATAASDDPGAWTSSAPNAGASAFSVVVPPASAVTEDKRRRYAQSYTIAHRRAALR